MTKQKIYVIKDSEKHYNGCLNINANSDDGRSDYKWDYFSAIYPYKGNGTKEGAEKDLMRLQELNKFAGYDLSWEVVELTLEEIFELERVQRLKDQELGINEKLSDLLNVSSISKAIQKGCIGKHRKIVKEIYKKYEFLERGVVA